MRQTPSIRIIMWFALFATLFFTVPLSADEGIIRDIDPADLVAVDPDGNRNPPRAADASGTGRSSPPAPLPPFQQIRTAVVSCPEGEEARTMSLVIRDFNSDGCKDAAVTTDYCGDAYPWDEQGLTILLGDESGRFEEYTRYTWNFFDPHTIFQTVACGDFNEDGTPDLAILNAPFGTSAMPAVIFMLGRGNGTFEEVTPHRELSAEVRMMPTPSKRLRLGDFDEDGHLDVGVASTSLGEEIVNLEVLFGDGSCSFTSSVFPGENPSCTAIGSGDFNGDGHPDVMTAGGSGVSLYSVYLNDSGGSGGFTPFHVTIPDFEITSMAVGDLDGDGHLDAVFPGHGGDETACMIFGTGDGTFSDPVPLRHHLFGYTGVKGMDVAIADVNDDQKADLVFGNEGASSIEGVWAHGALFVFPGNGDGSFRGVSNGGLVVELPSVPEPNSSFTCYDVVAADVDGDGDEDITASTMFRSAVETFLNRLWKDTPEIWIDPHPSLESYQPYDEVAIGITDCQGWQNLDAGTFTVTWHGIDISGLISSNTTWQGSAGGCAVRGVIPGLQIPAGDHWMTLGIGDLDGNTHSAAYHFTD